MSFTFHEGMTLDPHGDIHKTVAGDRAVVTAIAAANPKTATSFRTAELIMEFHGWKNGGGKTAYDAENA